jgi:hypothetical protein
VDVVLYGANDNAPDTLRAWLGKHGQVALLLEPLTSTGLLAATVVTAQTPATVQVNRSCCGCLCG